MEGRAVLDDTGAFVDPAVKNLINFLVCWLMKVEIEVFSLYSCISGDPRDFGHSFFTLLMKVFILASSSEENIFRSKKGLVAFFGVSAGLKILKEGSSLFYSLRT